MNPEIGLPLHELMGNSLSIAPANGPSLCADVMGACGFNVTAQSHAPQPQPQPSNVASLVTSYKPQMS